MIQASNAQFKMNLFLCSSNSSGILIERRVVKVA